MTMPTPKRTPTSSDEATAEQNVAAKPANPTVTPGEDEIARQWVEELWKKYRNDIPWADSPPGPE